MKQTIKLCPSCKETGKNQQNRKPQWNINFEKFSSLSKGLIGMYYDEENMDICPYCNTPLLDLDFDQQDFWDIIDATDSNKDVLDSMIKLAKENPIEYALKIDQFRQIAERKRNEAWNNIGTTKATSNIPTCPTCNSTNVEKISLSSKAVGGFFFGLFSSDVRNSMCCNNCGYKW